jgi:hypothetical protein
MKFNLNVAVKNVDGTVHERVIHKVGANGVHVVDESGAFQFASVEAKTLRSYCMDALGGTYKGEEEMSGEDRLKRFQIGIKIADAAEGEVDLTREQQTALLDVVRKAFQGPNSLAIYARLHLLLDAAAELKEVKAEALAGT